MKYFTEVWQYGSDLGRADGVPPTPDNLQDGVAPQASVNGIDNPNVEIPHGRVYIPNTEKKGFVTSHSIDNYGWIFAKMDGDAGFVKPRN